MLAHTFKGVVVLVTFLSFPFFVSADHCAVSKVSIVAGPWENDSAKTSFTLQSQNDVGESCHVSETLRLSIESSGSGSFTGQSGNALQLYISSNSSNRNFYYQHGGEDSYALTVKAGYGTADSWSETFTANYSSAESLETDNDESDSQSEDDESEDDGSSSSGTLSSHYGSASLSHLKQSEKLSLGAGRNRLGATGAPMEFRASVSLEGAKGSYFTWNFGDGNVGTGEVVSHAYEYPGEYAVLLEYSDSNSYAVARTNVRVIDPALTVTLSTSERVEVRNDSNHEVNLYGRALWAGDHAFAFPRDTIIKAGQNISFSSKTTGLKPIEGRAMIVVIGNEELTQAHVIAKVEEEKLNQITQIKSEIKALQERLSNAYQEEPDPISTVITEASSTSQLDIEVTNNAASNEELLTASAIEAVTDVEVESEEGWFQILKRFFLRTR